MIIKLNSAIPADVVAEAIKESHGPVLVLVPLHHPMRYVDSLVYAAEFEPLMSVALDIESEEDLRAASVYGATLGLGKAVAVVAEGIALPSWWEKKATVIQLTEPCAAISGTVQLQTLLGLPQPPAEGNHADESA